MEKYWKYNVNMLKMWWKYIWSIQQQNQRPMVTNIQYQRPANNQPPVVDSKLKICSFFPNCKFTAQHCKFHNPDNGPHYLTAPAPIPALMAPHPPPYDQQSSLDNTQRCSFINKCRSKATCGKYHPKEPCKKFPKCTTGVSHCRYIHPSCKDARYGCYIDNCQTAGKDHKWWNGILCRHWNVYQNDIHHLRHN